MKELWNKQAEKIREILLDKQIKICIVETVTCGQLTALLASTPGSSQYLVNSLITQNNKNISSLLHISENILEQYGTANEKVVATMSSQMAQITLESNYGIAVTGVTSLDNIKSNVPVGTIFVSLHDWDKNRNVTRQFFFPNHNLTPQEIINNAITEILNFIINFITKN